MLKFDQSKSISSLGAIISGINLSNKISSEEKEALNNLWSKFYILIFPNQILEHKEFENFSLTFGKFGHDPFIESIDNHPNIIEVKKEAAEKVHPPMTCFLKLNVS